MKTEKLLKTLPMLHDQLDALLGFDATTQVDALKATRKNVLSV